MASNCYLAYDEKTKEAVVIDPGEEADYIESIIADLGIVPKFILVTHGHSDHTLAVSELKLAYRIPLLMSNLDGFLLRKLLYARAIPPQIDKNITDNDEIRLGSLIIKAVAIGGHTPGSLAYFCNNRVFTGDALFADGTIGRYDFNYADKEILIRSIAKLKKLAKGMRVYPGHGEEFML